MRGGVARMSDETKRQDQGTGSFLGHESQQEARDPLYALVSMIQKLKQRRMTANELYVRRVLKDQVGLSEHDIDSLFGHAIHGYMIRRLSVKQNIEPIVLYLRSIGIIGSALVDMIVREPLILCTSVDDVYMVYGWLTRIVSHGTAPCAPVAVLLACPRLVMDMATNIEDLEQAEQMIKTACITNTTRMPPGDILKTFVCQYPDAFYSLVKDTRGWNKAVVDQYIKAIDEYLVHHLYDGPGP